MEKSVDASSDFYTGRSFPKGFRTNLKKEVHDIEERILLEYFLVFPGKASDKYPKALGERYEEIFYEREKNENGVFPEFFFVHREQERGDG